jgi:Kef-type K+ transport system membrane component KefB
MGWSGTEALFLAAALSISSSAVLIKVVSDSGKPFEAHGKLIIWYLGD